ncbi:hypothetical protein AAG906_012009 [Vitis piasezkii]
MATPNSTPIDSSSGDEAAAKAMHKRYEGLVTVRTKAIKGKGAWYWAHLEPILVPNPDTGLPKAVKLKCSLCEAVFSASNPSRTASEHLKRGTCPNFSSALRPISTVSPSLALPPSHNHRKRSAHMGAPSSSYHVSSLAMVDSPRFCGELGYSSPPPVQNPVGSGGEKVLSHHQLVLSGGKEDLGALAMLEDSVKRLKSPKASPGPELSKEQINSALELLADWFYESCGSVSFSSLEHPKFQAFLNQVGLPSVSRREFSGARLDTKFDEAKIESEARIRDAMFFQVASDGWNSKNFGFSSGEENLVKFTVNLPNGTSVFQKAVFTGGSVPSKHAEEILCVGIVADKYKAKALRNLEIQNHWMVNLSCQLQGFISLIKDFSKELPLFSIVTEKCLKLANFINIKSQVRHSFHKFQLQELDHVGLLRNFVHVYAMLEDIMSNAQVLQLVVMDESYKVICVEDPAAREVADMIQDVRFWNELDAVHSLVKLIREMAQEIEVERPLVGQCLPLWEELRTKVREWCVKFNIDEEPVEKIVEKRFRKTTIRPGQLHLYLTLLLDEGYEWEIPSTIQEEAHIALMELMKWRSEGLDPLYAQAVQVKQQDPVTGKMKIANPQSSRLVAVRLIFLHATACGFKCNWSFMRWVCVHGHSRVGLDRAQKMIFIAAHAKLERQDFSSEEEKDAELFAMANGESDMLNEVFADAPSV